MPDKNMKFYGPLPVFVDGRSAEAKADGIFPESQFVKRFISRAMLSCIANPALTPEEILTLLTEDGSHPPSRPSVAAVWPDIPMDAPLSPVRSGAAPGSVTGKTPSQAANQIKGGFLLL